MRSVKERFIILHFCFVLVIFPMDFMERGLWGKNFAMLGLGDIVIPGNI